MAYWLVNSGTSEEPLVGYLPQCYRQWEELNGPVQKFPATHRPGDMRPGDILIHRAVKSPDRIVAVAEVSSTAHRTQNDSQWKWQVERRLLHVCSDLSSAPGLADIDEERARGLRVYKRLPQAHGQRAQALIAEAGTAWTPS